MFPPFLIQLVISLIIIGLVLYVVNLLPIDAGIKQIIRVVIIVFIVIWLLYALMGAAPGSFPRRSGLIDLRTPWAGLFQCPAVMLRRA